MKTRLEQIRHLKNFMPINQLRTIWHHCQHGEEKQYFRELLFSVATTTERMPGLYETDGQGEAAIVHLHYFSKSSDFYIIEKDHTEQQLEAFGLASLAGNYPELGYISIAELIAAGVELDLHWTPRPLSEIKKELAA